MEPVKKKTGYDAAIVLNSIPCGGEINKHEEGEKTAATPGGKKKEIKDGTGLVIEILNQKPEKKKIGYSAADKKNSEAWE